MRLIGLALLALAAGMRASLAAPPHTHLVAAGAGAGSAGTAAGAAGGSGAACGSTSAAASLQDRT
jgi:hypothetical protein